MVREEQQDQREHEHAEDLGADADVVDGGQEPNADDIDQRRRQKGDETDERLHVEPREWRRIGQLDLVRVHGR